MRLRFTELFEVFWLEQRREEPFASSEQVIAELRGKLSAPVSAASIKLHTCWGCGLLSTFVPGRVPWALSTEPKSWRFQSGWDLHRHFAHPPQLHLRLPGQILFFCRAALFSAVLPGGFSFRFPCVSRRFVQIIFVPVPLPCASCVAASSHFSHGFFVECMLRRCTARLAFSSLAERVIRAGKHLSL